MIRQLAAAAGVLSVAIGGVVLAQSSERVRPVDELEYVTVEAGDSYWSLRRDLVLSCTHTELWAANGRAPLDPGTIVFIPPTCRATPTTTVPPTTVPPTDPPTTTAPPTTAPPTTMPPMGDIDTSALPAPVAGASDPRIEPTSRVPYAPLDGYTGAFRTSCELSHFNFDDPIVHPGQVGASHLHIYWGRTAVNALSTAPFAAGRSTCDGGSVNSSGYWMPAMIDTATMRPVVSAAQDAVQVYYKTGYQGVANAEVQAPPADLRIVAGDPRSTVPQANPHVYFRCSAAGMQGPTIPICPPGDTLLSTVVFPQCWNGRDLDSADHRSHMAYGRWAANPDLDPGGCPDTHPVAIPEITMNARYPVPASGMAGWRLVTDLVHTGPAGSSNHGDWWNGWDPDVMDRIVTNCLNLGLDCELNLLGDGFELAN